MMSVFNLSNPAPTISMLARRGSLFVWAMLSMLLLAPAFAQSEQPFTESAFRTAQQQGKTILLEVHADWCATCKKQTAVLNELVKEKSYADLVRFRIDYDHPETDLKALGVKSQATLVLFKGDKEVGRSAFETSERSIRTLLDKAKRA